MDTRALDKLHYTGDEYVFAVAYGVYFDFSSGDVFVDKNGLVLVYFNGCFEVVAEHFFVCDYLHSSAAENEARTYEHGIAYSCRRGNAVLYLCYGCALGLGNIQGLQYFFKRIAVFRFVYRVNIRSDYLYAVLHERLCKVYCRLTAQTCDNAVGLFHFDYIHYVLNGKRLEIELVARRVVRRNGFGVVVYYYGFVAFALYRLYRVNCGIVEFHALTYTDRTGTENDDFFLVEDYRFVFFFVCGVEVGDIAVKLRCAGVYHLVYGEDVFFLSCIEDFSFARFPEFCYKLVGKAHLFCRAERFCIALVCGNFFFHVRYVLYLFEEEHVYFRYVIDPAHIGAVAEELCNSAYTVVASVFYVGEKLVLGVFFEFCGIYVAKSRFERADSFEYALFERSAYGHDLARRFHLRAELVIRVGEFVEREAGHFCYYVVERWLECRGSVCYSYLVERHSYGNLCGYARYRITARLACKSGGA